MGGGEKIIRQKIKKPLNFLKGFFITGQEYKRRSMELR
jgi:hypothetical protein